MPSRAQDSVRVGELNSYTRMAVFSGPYRNGMELAMDEINAKGGVMGGKKLDIIFRDDGGTPVLAVRDDGEGHQYQERALCARSDQRSRAIR